MLVLSVATFAASCTEGDKFDPDKEVVMMSGTGSTPLSSLVVEEPGASYALSVSSTGVVDKDVKVTIAYSAAALDKYNEENGTSYVAVPESAVTLDNTNLTIEAGAASSDVCNATVTNIDFFESGVTYAIPVTITGVSG